SSAASAWRSPCGRTSSTATPLVSCASTAAAKSKRSAARRTSAQAREPCSHKSWLRSEEHTSELQSRENLVCRLLLEKKKKTCEDRARPPCYSCTTASSRRQTATSTTTTVTSHRPPPPKCAVHYASGSVWHSHPAPNP